MARPFEPVPSSALELYEFILDFKESNDGIAPSTGEIMEATGISSSSMVSFYLQKLENAGMVRLLRADSGLKSPRGIVVIGSSWQPPPAPPF